MFDFSKVKSWTIPEGVVKQVTDASGRVLWLGVRDRVGTLYMRPSADISFTGDKYPEDLAYGYLAISEKVADGYATYIGGTENAMQWADYEIEGTFSLSLDNAASVKKVISGEVGISYLTVSGNITHNPNFTVRVSVLGNVYELIKITHAGSVNFDGLRTATIPAGMIADINNYLATNGVLPAISLYIFASACSHNDQAVKVEATAKIDQAYLSLECEYMG